MKETNKNKNNKIKIDKKTIIHDLLSLVICILVAIAFNQFIVINANVPTSSMVYTIPEHSRLFGNRLSYITKDPQRGDIVIFWAPDEDKTLYVKRVIGLPGDTVEIYGGKTYVNGVALQEDYLPEEMLGVFGPYNVPEDSYFVLGDNRNYSGDARFWKAKTYITKDDIVAKAIFMYYPKIKKLN